MAKTKTPNSLSHVGGDSFLFTCPGHTEVPVTIDSNGNSSCDDGEVADTLGADPDLGYHAAGAVKYGAVRW